MRCGMDLKRLLYAVLVLVMAIGLASCACGECQEGFKEGFEEGYEKGKGGGGGGGGGGGDGSGTKAGSPCHKVCTFQMGCKEHTDMDLCIGNCVDQGSYSKSETDCILSSTCTEYSKCFK